MDSMPVRLNSYMDTKVEALEQYILQIAIFS
jgi:hypothetical protein